MKVRTTNYEVRSEDGEPDVGRGAVDVSALRLADLIAPGLDLLFVGFNPSVYSAIHGHFYARPGNRFWLLLALAGLTPRQYAPSEDATLLDLRIGITDLCPIPTPGIADVPRAVAESGRGALTAKIEQYAPRIVSFNGRATYERFFGHKLADWGVQPDRLGTAPSLVFVTPSSSGRANGVGVAREAAYLALGELIDQLRRARTDVGALPASSIDK